MKKTAVMALAAMLLCAPALASADYWTSNADFYYHANAGCGGLRSLVPISAEAAQAFSKHVCPVCMPMQDGGEDVRAVSRGGTIVVRFSDAWLSEHELTDVFGWTMPGTYHGEKAMAALGQYLHGEAYSTFLQAWQAEGAAEGRADTPHILAADGALIMSKRHIGAAWYIIVRPQQQFSENWDMYWRVSSMKLSAQDESLSVDFDRQTVEETRTLALERMEGWDAAYEHSDKDMDLAVYRALEGNIAVIREKNAEGNSLESVQLHIEGAHESISLSGYAEGEAAIYCCMLTDAELAALKKNARLELRHAENVNESIYRISAAEQYAYCSRETDEVLFLIDKAGGVDPVDASFRLVLDGVPACFAVQADGRDYIMDYAGNKYALGFMEDHEAERITPLVWYGEQGVFLAEEHDGKDLAVGEYLLAEGVKTGKRYELEKNKKGEDYRCWLMDEKGKRISSWYCNAFTVKENGEIHMENFAEDTTEIYGPYK